MSTTEPTTPKGAAKSGRAKEPASALARTSDRLQKLLQAARQLGSTLDPREIYEALARLLQDSVTFDGLIVSSFDPALQQITCQYAWVEGERLDPAGLPPLKLGAENEGMQSRVIRTGLPYLFSDVEQRVRDKGTYYEVTPDGEAERMSREAPPDSDYKATRSAMMAPIVLDGQVLGVVQVMSMREGAYTQGDLELMEGMVLQMGAAARNAALYAKAQREVEERTKAQASIEELNRRLQRAMAETHHRVKNNLQVLAALVDMQVDESGETVPRSTLERLRLQIQSLSSLHDLLTQAAKSRGSADSVPVHAALEKLVETISTTSGDREMTLDSDEIEMPARQSTAFTLLVNEVISNAIKHGSGPITIQVTLTSEWPMGMERRATRRVIVDICDEGPGFPEGFDPRVAANTGMELIDSLSRWDLNGWISYINRPEGGAQVVATFPLVEA